MDKKAFLGFRAEEDTAEFVRLESRKSHKTMSDWIRDEIKSNMRLKK